MTLDPGNLFHVGFVVASIPAAVVWRTAESPAPSVTTRAPAVFTTLMAGARRSSSASRRGR